MREIKINTAQVLSLFKVDVFMKVTINILAAALLSFFFVSEVAAKVIKADDDSIIKVYKDSVETLKSSASSWYDDGAIGSDLEFLLEYIESDDDFIVWINRWELLTPSNPGHNHFYVASQSDMDVNISRMLAWYFIVEFREETLNGSRWQEIYQFIDSRNANALINYINAEGPIVWQLRDYLYQYLDLILKDIDLLSATAQKLEIFELDEGLPILGVNVQHDAVVLARNMLKIHGFPTYELPQKLQIYDRNLVVVAKRFQRYYGLKPDGIIGPKTWHKLSQAPQATLISIQYTLTEIRSRPVSASWSDAAFINIPAYEMYIDNKPAMKVIIGTKKNQTPVLEDLINGIVINPEWNIPKRIVDELIKPAMDQDPSYLKKNNIDVYLGWGKNRLKVEEDLLSHQLSKDHYLVQKAGPWNALGEVKFLTTNSQAILLHDTNAPYLFEQMDRAMSNGCVRLEKPWELVDYLAEQKHFRAFSQKIRQRWTKMGEPKYVKLKKPLKIKSVYWLAWVDSNSQLHIYRDVYGLKT